MKGGKLYGEGSDGAVFGNPRLPCSDYEGDDGIKPNEVSKITLEDYYHEMYQETVLPILNKVFPNKRKLLKYFLLPKKLCLVKGFTKIDRFDEIYDKSWLDNSKTLLGFDKEQKMYNILYNGYPAKLGFLRQYIYEKADKNIDELLQILKNKKEAVQLLYKAIELYEGLSYIHHHKFYHNDVKIDNIMMIHNTLKFIDNDRFADTSTTFEYIEHMSKNIFYIGYSPIIIYYHIENDHSMDIYKLLMNEDFVDDNMINYCTFLLNKFYKIFISIRKSTLSNEQKDTLFQILNYLLNIYMYGLLEDTTRQILWTDNDIVVENKISSLLDTWKMLRAVHKGINKGTITKENIYTRFPNVQYIDNFFTKYNEKFLPNVKKGGTREEFQNLTSYIGVSNDMCGFLFIVIQICTELFDAKYSELHSSLFDVVMMSCRLMIQSIERPIENADSFIQESANNMRRLRNILKDDFHELLTESTEPRCRGSMCSIMGGRKTRYKKRRSKRNTRKGRK
jgi:hypothetical protein